MEKQLNSKETAEKKAHLRREIRLIVYAAIILFSALVLLSYSSHDPSFFTEQVFSGEKTRNFFGRFGANVAALAVQGFGLAAYLVPLYLTAVLFYSRLLTEFAINIPRVMFFVLSLVSFAAFLSALVPSQSLFGVSIPLGGMTGLVIANVLSRYLNISGCLFISLLAFVVFSILALEKNIFRKLLAMGIALARTVPRLVAFRQKSSKTETRPPKVVKPLQQPKEPAAPLAAEEPSKEPQRHGGDTLPPLSLLAINKDKYAGPGDAEIQENSHIIEECLMHFDITVRISEVHPGPVVTMYEFIPEQGTKISRILNLEHELTMALKAVSLRIVAPIPGKSSIGIEVSNKKLATVYIRELISSEEFANRHLKLPLSLGKGTTGNPFITDLVKMPHLLVAGSTGSGKSVSINAMILSVLYRMGPDDAKFIMIDPKMLELNLYRDIPHLLYPVVTAPDDAAKVLRWAIREMDRRYELMANASVRNIEQFNTRVAEKKQKELFDDGEAEARLPYVVIIIDELADLMMVAAKDVETCITRLAQKARAAGIHMIVATQRPSVDVITGLIKANFPARIAFKVASKTDSRTILDANGADSLLGQGDMLFLQPGTSHLLRLHGAFVTEQEIQSVVGFWKGQGRPAYIEIVDEPGADGAEEGLFEDDKYEEAVKIVKETRQASISHLQRRLRVGYNRAARMIERMEQEGLVSPADGARPRDVLF